MCGLATDVLGQYRQRLVLRLPLDVAVLPLMRSRVRTFLGQDDLGGELVDDVVLCIQEACKNAIRFSHSSRGVLVRVGVDDGAVRVVVRDYGVGMKPAPRAVASPLAESGRGLSIIRALMDDVEVRVQDGTELRMRRSLPLAGRGDADGPLALSA